MQTARGRTIKLFLIDGVPDGMMTAEIMSWTGHVLAAPRSRVGDILARKEAQKTGVYLLVGRDPISDTPRVYVGEGDNVGVRLAAHDDDGDKDFWETLCIITSKDMNLTKGHVRYLESRLIEAIEAEGRALLANKTSPKFRLLPEADTSDMDDFLTRLQVLLPVLGLEFLRPTPAVLAKPVRSGAEIEVADTGGRAPTLTVRPTSEGGSSPEFMMQVRGAEARAVELNGRMIVLGGSTAREEVLASIASNVKSLREQYIRTGKLVPSDVSGLLRFASDAAFPSPSAAAQAVAGTSRNGREDWQTADRRTYAQWQEEQIQNARSRMTASTSEEVSPNGAHAGDGA